MTCAKCKFWREPFETPEGMKGHCKKDPPIAIVTKQEGNNGPFDELVWTQPLCRATDYCFHFMDKG